MSQYFPQRFALAFFALLSTQVMAADDNNLFFSSEPTKVITNGGASAPEPDTESYGGNRPSDTPDIGGSQKASAEPAKKEHPKPELPAGWTAPEDASVSNTGTYGNNANPFTTGIFSANGLGGSNLAGGANSGAALSQIQQLLQNAGAQGGTTGYNAPRASGNLAISSGFGANTTSNYSRSGIPALNVGGIMNSPLAMAAAASSGDGDGPSSPEERAMMAAYFQQLLQYIQSQPATNLGSGTYGNSYSGFAGSYSTPNYGLSTPTTRQPARAIAVGSAAGSVAGGGSATLRTGGTLQPAAFR